MEGKFYNVEVGPNLSGNITKGIGAGVLLGAIALIKSAIEDHRRKDQPVTTKEGFKVTTPKGGILEWTRTTTKEGKVIEEQPIAQGFKGKRYRDLEGNPVDRNGNRI